MTESPQLCQAIRTLRLQAPQNSSEADALRLEIMGELFPEFKQASHLARTMSREGLLSPGLDDKVQRASDLRYEERLVKVTEAVVQGLAAGDLDMTDPKFQLFQNIMYEKSPHTVVSPHTHPWAFHK